MFLGVDEGMDGRYKGYSDTVRADKRNSIMAEMVTGNKVPFYNQVAQTLRQRVRTGEYPSGCSLPSVRALSEEFQVSLKVVQRAIHTLAEAGVVATHHGKGMTVMREEPCERAAISFGVIQPFVRSQLFHSAVLEFVNEAFAERSNFSVVRSSRDDPELEREIAEHLIANGVKGLLLWPVNNDPNGDYFKKLSEKIPVVLVDRLLKGAELPAVVHDYFDAGKEICGRLLGKMHKHRFLVLMDDLEISPYAQTILGIQHAAKELGKEKKVSIFRWPICEMLNRITERHYGLVNRYARKVETLIAEGEYDAVFCSQSEFLDFGVVQTGITDKYERIQLATMGCKVASPGSRKFNNARPLEWVYDSGQMVTIAADLLQKWVMTRQIPTTVTKLKLTMCPVRKKI